MKSTKRQCDPLGRSKTRHRYSRHLLSLAIAITGSVWPIQARSIEAIFDRHADEQGVTSVATRLHQRLHAGLSRRWHPEIAICDLFVKGASRGPQCVSHRLIGHLRRRGARV
jgi:hypothetical protein